MSSKKDSIWQECFSTCIDWQNRIFDLSSHFQDGGYNVISPRQVLPPGEWKGGAENAGRENDGREKAGHENAGMK